MVSISFLGSNGDTPAMVQQLQRQGTVLVFNHYMLRPSWFQWFLPLLGAHDPLDAEKRRAFSPERRNSLSMERWSPFSFKKGKSIDVLHMPHLSEVRGPLLAESFTAVSEARLRAVDLELGALLVNGGQVSYSLSLFIHLVTAQCYLVVCSTYAN